jgi:hypothetical protein
MNRFLALLASILAFVFQFQSASYSADFAVTQSDSNPDIRLLDSAGGVVDSVTYSSGIAIADIIADPASDGLLALTTGEPWNTSAKILHVSRTGTLSVVADVQYAIAPGGNLVSLGTNGFAVTQHDSNPSIFFLDQSGAVVNTITYSPGVAITDIIADPASDGLLALTVGQPWNTIAKILHVSPTGAVNVVADVQYAIGPGGDLVSFGNNGFAVTQSDATASVKILDQSGAVVNTVTYDPGVIIADIIDDPASDGLLALTDGPSGRIAKILHVSPGGALSVVTDVQYAIGQRGNLVSFQVPEPKSLAMQLICFCAIAFVRYSYRGGLTLN